MKKFFLIFLLSIFLFNFASAIDSHKIDTDYNLVISSNKGTECLLTYIQYPNNSQTIYNINLTKDGTSFYSTINQGNFSSNGNVCMGLKCSYGTEILTDEKCLDITRSGTSLTQQQSTIYIFLGFAVFILFALSLYFMVVMPYSNEVNNKNAVIKICRLKYLKMGLIMLTWVLFTWFLNILISLSDNFVSIDIYYGFFSFLFDTMLNLTLPIGIFIFVLAFFEIIRDVNIQKQIKRFGSALR